ncbi:hypothetical protein GCM10018787_38730 [Streptomyces thermodiastaticus]|nr:hypothetical protein GCM10018787_38730 [Streptomyces thermodiastaticus]
MHGLQPGARLPQQPAHPQQRTGPRGRARRGIDDGGELSQRQISRAARTWAGSGAPGGRRLDARTPVPHAVRGARSGRTAVALSQMTAVRHKISGGRLVRRSLR